MHDETRLPMLPSNVPATLITNISLNAEAAVLNGNTVAAGPTLLVFEVPAPRRHAIAPPLPPPTELTRSRSTQSLLAGEHEDAFITGMTRSLNRRMLGLRLPQCATQATPAAAPAIGPRAMVAGLLTGGNKRTA